MKREWWLLGGLVAYGLLLRLYGLGTLSLWLDEAITIYAAQQVVLTGIPLFPSGWLYTAGLPHTYLVALFGLISWDAFWLRLPSVIAGAALIVVSFFSAKDVWNERVGWMLAIFVTVSYWLIAWSRQVRMYVFLTFFTVLAFWFLYRFLRDGRRNDLLVMILGCFLAVFLHGFGALVAAFCLLALLIAQRFTLPGGAWWQAVYGFIGAGFAWYAVRVAFRLSLEMNYSVLYATWLWGAFGTLIVLLPFSLLLEWKERYLLGFLVTLYVILSFFIPLFHQRYFVWVLPVIAVLGFVVLEKYLFGWKYWVVAGLVVFGASPMFLPASEVYLEPLTPQPPWEEVYAAIPDGYLVDAHPFIASYYGVEADAWLANSLSGRGEIGDHDRYTGLPASEPVGVVVLDDRAAVTAGVDLTNATVFGNRHWRRAYIIR